MANANKYNETLQGCDDINLQNEIPDDQVESTHKLRKRNPRAILAIENNHEAVWNNDITLKAALLQLHTAAMGILIMRTPKYNRMFPNDLNPDLENIELVWNTFGKLIGNDKIDQNPIQFMSNIIEIMFNTLAENMNVTFSLFKKITDLFGTVSSTMDNIKDAQSQAEKDDINSNKENLSEAILSAVHTAATELTLLASAGSSTCDNLETIVAAIDKPLEDCEFITKLMNGNPTFKNLKNMKDKVDQLKDTIHKSRNTFQEQQKWDPVKVNALPITIVTPSHSEKMHSPSIHVDEQSCSSEDCQVVNPAVTINQEIEQSDNFNELCEVGEQTHENSIGNQDKGIEVPASSSKAITSLTPMEKQTSTKHTQTEIPDLTTSQKPKLRKRRKIRQTQKTNTKKPKYQFLKCALCGDDKTFANEFVLNRHMDTKHNRNKEKLKCSFCKKEIGREDYLQKHIAFSCKENPDSLVNTSRKGHSIKKK